jgi:ABC-type polar amino acid transport system ATPase subunit
MLAATGITKLFDGKVILDGVDVKVKSGEITCVIGPSGCGKTTLLRALALLDYPDQGRIAIDDISYDFPIHKKDKVTPPWPKVTAVFQSLFLWPHLTLRENIMLPARNCNPNAQDDLQELIALFEMENFIDHYPNQASIGQRQRAAIVRALMLNPRYILLDEITSALDVEQSARILSRLEVLKTRGIGVFMITHALGFARRAANEVLFMDSGKIIECGSSKILESPQTERFQLFLSSASNMA